MRGADHQTQEEARSGPYVLKHQGEMVRGQQVGQGGEILANNRPLGHLV